MSAQTPSTREAMNLGMFQMIANFANMIGLGDFFGVLIQALLGASKVQSSVFTATGATQTVTFASLGMTPPASVNYRIFVSSATTTGRVQAGTKTVAQVGLAGLTNTEATDIVMIEDNGPASADLTVTSNVATLAAKPAILLDVVALAGTTLGRKVLKIGAGLVPAVGEVVWDGNVTLTFNATDAVTSALVVSLPTAGVLASLLERRLGQRDDV